ncbi:MAG: hypothetical protein WCI02_08120 [Planctomycetota bacterium]
MSKPSNRRVKAHSGNHETGRPRLLGWLVIAGGTLSTWGWYRPLPKSPEPELSATRSSDSLQPRTSIWDKAGLLLPATGVPESEVSRKSQAQIGPLPEDLVGDGDVALQPFQEDRNRALKDRVGKEPLPVVPIDAPLAALGRAPAKPPLWTDPSPAGTDSRLSSIRAFRESESVASSRTPVPGAEPDASPFRAGAVLSSPKIEADSFQNMASKSVSKELQWPDEGYRKGLNTPVEFRADRVAESMFPPSDRKLPSFHTATREDSAQPSSKMSLSSNRIRTEETDSKIQVLPRPGFTEPAQNRPRPAGNVIRQPIRQSIGKPDSGAN